MEPIEQAIAATLCLTGKASEKDSERVTDATAARQDGAKIYSVENPVTWTKRGIAVCPECFGKNVVTSEDAREQLKRWEVSDD